MNLKEKYELWLKKQTKSIFDTTPMLIADKLIGVQPMTAPTGAIFRFNRIKTSDQTQDV